MDAAGNFPIHTENAELVGRLMRDLKGKVTLVEKEKGHKIWWDLARLIR
jgi:hypothetical protein